MKTSRADNKHARLLSVLISYLVFHNYWPNTDSLEHARAGDSDHVIAGKKPDIKPYGQGSTGENG